jgi:outer membrane protein
MALRSHLGEKMIRVISLLGCLLLLPAAALADAQEKIGYIDMQSALHKTDQGKREEERLRKDSEEKQKKLDQMQNELKKLKDDFDKQGALMKDDARARKQAELQSKFADLQQFYATVQKDLADKSGVVTKEIASRVRAIVEKIADRDGYTLVLERNEANVLYCKRHLDLTDEVVRNYNTLYK